MAETADKIDGVLATAAYAVLATVPEGQTWIDSAMTLCNLSGAQRRFWLAIVPAADALDLGAGDPAPARHVFWNAPIESPMTMNCGRGWVLKAGDRVIWKADAADGVTAHLSFARRTV